MTFTVQAFYKGFWEVCFTAASVSEALRVMQGYQAESPDESFRLVGRSSNMA